MPLVTDKYSRNVFQFMKLKKMMTGEDSKLVGMCYKLAGTNFTIRKKNLMTMQEIKRSGIRIIVVFCGIPSRFPNQGRQDGSGGHDCSDVHVTTIVEAHQLARGGGDQQHIIQQKLHLRLKQPLLPKQVGR
jgi:hypothetical protein